MQKAPIAILSFNRPAYLKRTLASLAAQAGETLQNREIHLFQDGITNSISGHTYADQLVVSENKNTFLTFFPGGTTHIQETNLGIGLHFDYIEKFFFQTRNFDAAIFLEDDMILSPNYITIIDKLLLESTFNSRVGYVAAYGDHRASLDQQYENLGKIVQMDHKWGFALTRRQWLRQRPFVEQYINIIKNMDYSRRDHNKIIGFFLDQNILPRGTSQDGVKDVAMYLSDATKLMTYPCYGQYIGKVGVHSTEKLYDAMSYEDTKICDRIATSFIWPSGQELDRIVANFTNDLHANVKRVSEIFPNFKSGGNLGKGAAAAELNVGSLTGTASQEDGRGIAARIDGAAINQAGLVSGSNGERYAYFDNLFPNEPQFQSGLFVGLALKRRFERDIEHDVTTPLPFASDSIAGFQSQDVFEHLPYEKLPDILNEVYRCLRVGGIFRMSVPDYNSPLLRQRSVYDSNGNILCDVSMGGTVSCTLNGSVKASFAAGGDAHLWFPTYSNVLHLIISSEVRRCSQIKVQHAWLDANRYVCLPFDHGIMPVSRTPPADQRAGGKPISMVLDFIK